MSLIANRPLTTRLCAFFLTTIGLVLIAFSSVFYAFANVFLHRQVEERVASSVRALTAVVETSPEGVEWEPHARTFGSGDSSLTTDAVWIVLDQDTRPIDQSANLDTSEVASAILKPAPGSPNDTILQRWPHGNWLYGEQWIRNGESSAEVSEAAIESDGDEIFHDAVCVRVAVSLSPMHAMLHTMATTLIVLSGVVWLGSLFAARAVCSRALQPLRDMTSAVHQLTAEDLTDRLPNLQTQDEPGDLTKAFNAMLDRVEDSFLRQQRFTGDASHQLKTPLTAILGQIEVTQRRERSSDDYKRTLEVVHSRATHLKHIVEALLFLARADAEAELPDRQTIELRNLLTDWISIFAEHKRFADLKFDGSSIETAAVCGHATLLTELLTILVDNAFKFSHSGTPVIIQLNTNSDAAIVSICDRGLGISASDVLVLGTPFFRAESARQQGIEGVGLGLSIAFRIAKTLGGTLKFSSVEDQGTTVELRLPLSDTLTKSSAVTTFVSTTRT